MSEMGGDGVVDGEAVPVRPDARVYRMLLGEHGVDDYYDDSFELGLVGIGWSKWVEPAFIEGITDSSLKQKLKEAISAGKSRTFPVCAEKDDSPFVFPPDRPAVLQFDGLPAGDATQFVHHWLRHPPYEDLPKKTTYAANQVCVFLTARPGDVIVTRAPDGKYAYGVFSAVATSLELDHLNSRGKRSPERLKAPGGHVCRPVSWAAGGASESTVTSWLEAHGLGGASEVATFNQRHSIFVASAGGGKGRSLGYLTSREATHPSPKQESATMRTKETSSMHTLLQRAKTIILEGVPGTGKTWAIKNQICNTWQGLTLKGRGDDHYAITLHPATTYEDFVEGLRPTTAHAVPSGHLPGPSAVSDTRSVRHHGETFEGVHLIAHRYFHVQLPDVHEANTGETGASFAMQDGFFLRACAEATNHPENDYVVLLDEINRCNVPKVMGDLLTTLERSKRARWNDKERYWDLSPCQVVTLPGSKRLFFVPSNVYVVATMNSTDRSVAPLDAALRRRFAFHRCWPKGFDHGQRAEDVVKMFRDDIEHPERGGPLPTGAGERLDASVNAWATINANLLNDVNGGPDALLGHSYLTDLAGDLRAAGDDALEADTCVTHHWNHHLLPQLADVLLTHNLQALASPGGELLKITVGGRTIINETGGARRGQNTLIFKLKEYITSGMLSEDDTGEIPRNQATLLLNQETVKMVIRIVESTQNANPQRGIYVRFTDGRSQSWNKGRGRAKDTLFEHLQANARLGRVAFYAAGDDDMMQGTPTDLDTAMANGLEECRRFTTDRGNKSFACFFDQQFEPQVHAICEAMRKAALTP